LDWTVTQYLLSLINSKRACSSNNACNQIFATSRKNRLHVQHDTSVSVCKSFRLYLHFGGGRRTATATGVSSTSIMVPMQYLYSTLKEQRQSVIDYFQCQWDQWDKKEFLAPFNSFRKNYSEPSFHPNKNLSLPDNECRKRFEKALSVLRDRDVLHVAFHGTPASNLSRILQNGLDPPPVHRHHGEDFNPGEYFSVDPLIAAKYSSSTGRIWLPDMADLICIVVCVVIMPKRIATKQVVTANPNNHIPIGFMQCVKIPDRFIIKNENQRQLLARRYLNFHKRLQRLCVLPEEQVHMVKRQILLDLKIKQSVMASDLYGRFADLLKGSPECKAEILQEVLAQFPESVIATHFPWLLLEESSQNNGTTTGAVCGEDSYRVHLDRSLVEDSRTAYYIAPP
jgi:Poly(ADP-ribose) polymerase catalytic domain